VAGGGAELFDLGVDVVESDGGGSCPVGDADALDLFDEVGVGAFGDDEVGFESEDRFDVRVVAADAGHLVGGVGRVVREVVDGDHLVTGADGVEHLGGGR